MGYPVPFTIKVETLFHLPGKKDAGKRFANLAADMIMRGDFKSKRRIPEIEEFGGIFTIRAEAPSFISLVNFRPELKRQAADMGLNDNLVRARIMVHRQDNSSTLECV